MMAVILYCPICWYHTGELYETCPGYGHSRISQEVETYEEKLIRALSHPVREQRMIAIGILGSIRYIPAVPVFDRIVRNEEDAYVVREVIRALKKIGTPECTAILFSLQDHTSVVVKQELMVLKCSNPAMQNGIDLPKETDESWTCG
ncbi:MAG TPA: HEAT repeat domain-containing protein [Methanoregulaceae archaeon]|nr:HEAT repeat domain-containing protein [Methanoregulaceae archaeon]